MPQTSLFGHADAFGRDSALCLGAVSRNRTAVVGSQVVPTAPNRLDVVHLLGDCPGIFWMRWPEDLRANFILGVGEVRSRQFALERMRQFPAWDDQGIRAE